MNVDLVQCRGQDVAIIVVRFNKKNNKKTLESGSDCLIDTSVCKYIADSSAGKAGT